MGKKKNRHSEDRVELVPDQPAGRVPIYTVYKQVEERVFLVSVLGRNGDGTSYFSKDFAMAVAFFEGNKSLGTAAVTLEVYSPGKDTEGALVLEWSPVPIPDEEE